MASAQFLAELNERLFVHYTQNQWRAPLGARLLPVLAYDQGRPAHIVCAQEADITRAIQGVQTDAAPDLTELRAAVPAFMPELTALRAIERLAESPAAQTPVTLPDGAEPLVLLSAADAPIKTLIEVLIAGTTRGLVWKPAPAAAGSAHFTMSRLAPLAAGRLAMIQGDHETGALLAGQGAGTGMIWGSHHPIPSSLPTPVLSLSPTATHPR